MNKISDINTFEKVNFKELKELYLNNNEISDIKVFEKTLFKNPITIYLSGNKIEGKLINKNLGLNKKIKLKFTNY